MAQEPKQSERVIISGMGALSCLGIGVEEVADAASELSVLQQTERSRGARRTVGLVPPFELSEFTPTQRPDLDGRSRCAMAAAAMAIESAGVEPDEVDPLRCGLCFASVLGNLDTPARVRSAADSDVMSRASAQPTDHLLSVEFALGAGGQNFSGGRLCGAQALESAMLALRTGRADLMLAGGADAAEPAMLEAMYADHWEGPPPSQGAAMLVLETQDSVERRESFAFCELASVVCVEAGPDGSPDGLAAAIARAADRALAEARVWDGDVGLLQLWTDGCGRPAVLEAQRKALARFSQVPAASARPFVGETFGAGFPLECIVAADALCDGRVPGEVVFAGAGKGVEFWVERKPERMLGGAVLVVGCTAELAAAAVLVAL